MVREEGAFAWVWLGSGSEGYMQTSGCDERREALCCVDATGQHSGVCASELSRAKSTSYHPQELIRVHERRDGFDSTLLRCKAEPLQYEDVWVEGKPSVQEGEDVSMVREEEAFCVGTTVQRIGGLCANCISARA